MGDFTIFSGAEQKPFIYGMEGDGDVDRNLTEASKTIALENPQGQIMEGKEGADEEMNLFANQFSSGRDPQVVLERLIQEANTNGSKYEYRGKQNGVDTFRLRSAESLEAMKKKQSETERLQTAVSQGKAKLEPKPDFSLTPDKTDPDFALTGKDKTFGFKKGLDSEEKKTAANRALEGGFIHSEKFSSAAAARIAAHDAMGLASSPEHALSMGVAASKEKKLPDNVKPDDYKTPGTYFAKRANPSGSEEEVKLLNGEFDTRFAGMSPDDQWALIASAGDLKGADFEKHLFGDQATEKPFGANQVNPDVWADKEANKAMAAQIQSAYVDAQRELAVADRGWQAVQENGNDAQRREAFNRLDAAQKRVDGIKDVRANGLQTVADLEKLNGVLPADKQIQVTDAAKKAERDTGGLATFLDVYNKGKAVVSEINGIATGIKGVADSVQGYYDKADQFIEKEGEKLRASTKDLIEKFKIGTRDRVKTALIKGFDEAATQFIQKRGQQQNANQQALAEGAKVATNMTTQTFREAHNPTQALQQEAQQDQYKQQIAANRRKNSKFENPGVG